MKSTTWRKITAIATVIGILGTSFSANSFADEIVVSEETEFFAEKELDTAESFYPEDEFIVEESDDAIASVDDGIFTTEEETETVVKEGLSISGLGDELDAQTETETENESYLTASADVEVLEDTEGPTGGVGTGTITITSIMRVLNDEKTANPTSAAESYTFSLYKEDGNNLVSTKTITISTYNNRSTTSVTFDNLAEGVYYLKETGTTGTEPIKIKYAHTYIDTDGQWKKASGTQSDSGIKITIKRNGISPSETVTDIHKVEFTDVYSQADTFNGSFKIKVRVVDENNQETSATLTAGFTVKWTAGGKNWAVNPKPSLSLKDQASLTSKNYSIAFSRDDQHVTAKVRMVSLTDENSNSVSGKYSLVDDTDYTKLNSYEKTINITDGLEDGLVSFTLKEVPKKQSVAQLSITAFVTYHESPKRVTDQFHLGIFTDAAHTKLLFNKALELNNASSRTSTLKINLYKLKNKDHVITLYFAAVDASGRVLKNGSVFGYKLYPNVRSVTMSPTQEKASVILYCDMLEGTAQSKKPKIQKPKATKNKITVKWKHFKHTSKKTKPIWKKIKSVQIQCATDKAFRNIVKTATVKKSKASAKIKGLKKKTTYYVRVRYSDGTGYSAWSKVKKIKTK